jgi:hypothetical protein
VRSRRQAKALTGLCNPQAPGLRARVVAIAIVSQAGVFEGDFFHAVHL